MTQVESVLARPTIFLYACMPTERRSTRAFHRLIIPVVQKILDVPANLLFIYNEELLESIKLALRGKSVAPNQLQGLYFSHQTIPRNHRIPKISYVSTASLVTADKRESDCAYEYVGARAQKAIFIGGKQITDNSGRMDMYWKTMLSLHQRKARLLLIATLGGRVVQLNINLTERSGVEFFQAPARQYLDQALLRLFRPQN